MMRAPGVGAGGGEGRGPAVEERFLHAVELAATDLSRLRAETGARKPSDGVGVRRR